MRYPSSYNDQCCGSYNFQQTSHSSCVIFPVFMSSSNFHTCVPDPIVCPLYLPFSIGPPGTTIVGRPTLEAPITVDGVVLSQPVSNTTPSIGLPRIDSSASMLAKIPKQHGRWFQQCFSQAHDRKLNRENHRLPIHHVLPLSARSRKCALHGVSSLNVLQMPITGRPSK